MRILRRKNSYCILWRKYVYLTEIIVCVSYEEKTCTYITEKVLVSYGEITCILQRNYVYLTEKELVSYGVSTCILRRKPAELGRAEVISMYDEQVQPVGGGGRGGGALTMVS